MPLDRFFGTSGEFRLNLRKLWESRLAERKNGTAIADGEQLRASG